MRRHAQDAAFQSAADQSRLVLLCGPIARPNKPANGGFQSANLRMSRLLEGLGFRVKPLYYPDADFSAVEKLIAYLTSFLTIYVSLIVSPRAIVHATPLFRQFIALELPAFCIARMFGHRLVCDIRAGNLQQEYERRSTLYRWAFRQMVDMADVVSIENEQYLRFVEGIAEDRKAHVLPNFIPAEVVKHRSFERGAGPRLVFVGRVNDAKGIPQTLALHHRLKQMLPASSLCIIGAGDKPYVADLLARTRDDPSIEVLGPQEPGRIFEELDRAHFFVLLSAHAGEGHSNALTEAMARGCVPIATKHGFLDSVISNTGLTFATRDDIEAMARAVDTTWQSRAWEDMSLRAVARVEARYTDGAVLCVINDIYRQFELQHQAT